MVLESEQSMMGLIEPFDSFRLHLRIIKSCTETSDGILCNNQKNKRAWCTRVQTFRFLVSVGSGFVTDLAATTEECGVSQRQPGHIILKHRQKS